MTGVALVVMEPGSEWPGHVGASETLVALKPGQDTVRFTRERLAALRRQREEIHVAVLACNSAMDSATADQRIAVGREMLASISRHGRLVLTASAGRASSGLREHLLSLAETLTAGLRGTSATVTLRFTETEHRAEPVARRAS